MNLRFGRTEDGPKNTCTAGAGSLLVEFGILSRLIGDPVYESLARRTNAMLWDLRNEDTLLFGERFIVGPEGDNEDLTCENENNLEMEGKL